MNSYRITLICFLFLSTLSLRSQPSTSIFDSEEPLDLTLTTNLDSIIRDRDTNSNYYRAYLNYKENGKKQEVKVKIRTRGNFRLRADVCDFPPLWLKISKKQSQETLFQGQHKLKIVTHCHSDEYVLKEYLIYKLFNLFTENSFQVRLARITYKDSEKQYPTEKYFAFLIEDEDALAQRLGGKIIEREQIQQDSLDRDQDLLIRLFHYMVGNLDWNYDKVKNFELISRGPYKPILSIPYDFDFSACVNPPYTGLGETFNFRNYRPTCRAEAEYNACFQLFREKKTEIHALIDNFGYLKKSDKDKILQYLDEFYQMIDDPRQVASIFLAACNQNE